MRPELETERLALREFVTDDAEFILELLNQPSFIQFIGDKGVRSVADAKKYIVTGPIESYQRHGFGLYLVELKDSKAPIGMCGLLKRESLPFVDLGFAFLPEYWGKGYAFEAASAVLDHAREVLTLKRILAITNPDNDASINLLARLGFQFQRMMTMSGDSDEVKLFSVGLDTL
ncbi:MAG TPA: GNAT family N-acetyltransferase [Pyrinomonadaceae bacterium]|nr:GNAT family N-acetyltransferase [Pyrinomonadaceae bacterium]